MEAPQQVNPQQDIEGSQRDIGQESGVVGNDVGRRGVVPVEERASSVEKENEVGCENTDHDKPQS